MTVAVLGIPAAAAMRARSLPVAVAVEVAEQVLDVLAGRPARHAVNAPLLSAEAARTIGPYIPMNAGDQIYFLHHDAGSLGAWSGFGVFCLYAALALTIGLVLINHRDA